MGKALLADDSRVILAVSPQKNGIRIPTEPELQAALTAASAGPVAAWDDGGAARALMERAPVAGGVASRRTRDDLGITIVRFANGVEAWLKPTDFKNDQVLFTMVAPGGSSLAAPADFAGRRAGDVLCRRRRRRRPQRHRPAEGPDGQARVGQAVRLALHPRRAGQRGARATGNRAAASVSGGHQARRRCGVVCADEAAARSHGRQPGTRAGTGVRREARAGELLQPLHGAADDAGTGGRPQPRQDDGLLPGTLQQRGGLHVLHGGRLQGGRGRSAAGAVRRHAAVHRTAPFAVPRRGPALSRRQPARHRRAGTGAAWSDRDQLLRRSGRGSRRAGEHLGGHDRAGHRASRHPPRGSRPDLHGVGEPLAVAAPAGRRATFRCASAPRRKISSR